MNEETLSAAWLLPLSSGLRAAIGESEILYVLPDRPTLHRVPLAPEHAQHVIVWEKRIVPLIYVGQLFAAPGAEASRPVVVAIVAVGADAGPSDDFSLGALLLRAVPKRIEVSDASECELPAALAAWENLLSACFLLAEENMAVPILNLAALFMPAQEPARHQAALPPPAYRVFGPQIGD